MAGSRQHFLPRFLKKGFSSKIRKNEYFTWVFTKEGKPYEANLKNIGLENFFYGKPDESEIDEHITNQEDIYSKEINNLRALNANCYLDESFPSEFITHLIVRAKHLRESFQDVNTTIIDVVQRKLDTPQKCYQMLCNIFLNQPEVIEKSLSEELDKNLPPGFPQQMKKILVEYLKTFVPKVLPETAIKGFPVFNQGLSNMVKEMPNFAKEAHIKALSKAGIAPEKFIERFRGLDWSLIVTHKQTFILGDIGPVIRYEPDLHFKPFLFAKGELAQVFLPISDSHIIVGKSNNNLPIPDFGQINEASAALSQYYFISSENKETEHKLSQIIASKSSNISDDEISYMGKKLNKEWFNIES